MLAKKTENNEKITKVNKSIKQKETKKTSAKTSRVSTKVAEKKSTSKKNSKATTVKVATRKTSVKKASEKTTRKKVDLAIAKTKKDLLNKDLTKNFRLSEYYDLPAKYEKTIVKILAQTPNILFIYWDISNEDRKKFIDTYGPSFFYDTKPVLIITNITKNYTFEIDVNDFANCWYLHVNDTKCEYKVELGRRFISSYNLPNNYVYISSSNKIESPNDHILFEKEQKMVYFRNVKTNTISSKPITNLTFLLSLGKFYNIYEFYQNIYNENFSEESKIMGNSSSVFK